MSYDAIRAKRLRLAVALSPLAVALIVCPAFLAWSESRYGNGFIGLGAWLLFGVFCSVPMLAPVIVAAVRFRRGGVSAAFWPVLFGIAGALPEILRYATVNLASDAQAGIALVWGPIVSIKWAILGALIGLGLTYVPALRFRLSCEAALTESACSSCGYDRTGLRSKACPECGQTAP